MGRQNLNGAAGTVYESRRRDSLLRPFLKWAGGKRQLLPEIRKYLPLNLDDLRYFEPFVGASALLWDIQPHAAVINDRNKDLILTLLVVRDQVDELIRILGEYRDQNSESFYYAIRNQDRDKDAFVQVADAEKAARLIYLNKTCYNGLYRVNSRGLFNVPYGRYEKPAICDSPLLTAIHRYLNHEGAEIEILCGDFAAAVSEAVRQSFVYFDPPYHSPDKTNFTRYLVEGFGEADQIRLRDTFSRLTDLGARCLLSNADTPFIRTLYSDVRYEIIPVKAKRLINSDRMGRGKVREVLIRNWR